MVCRGAIHSGAFKLDIVCVFMYNCMYVMYVLVSAVRGSIVVEWISRTLFTMMTRQRFRTPLQAQMGPTQIRMHSPVLYTNRIIQQTAHPISI